MRMFRRPPAIGTIPTIDGTPPDPDVQEQVVANQVRAAQAWRDTADDLAINNMVNAREQQRETRWEVVVLAVLVVILFFCGLWYTYTNYTHDRAVAAQRSAAQQTPYTPETIR